MGINLGNLEQTSQPLNSAPTSTPTQASGLSLNLQKNDFLDLTKRNPGLTKVDFATGWDVSENGADFDLDIMAMLIHQDTNKIKTASDIIYFNHKEIAPFIKLNQDDRTGASSDGNDDEVISLDLSQVPSDISKIVFAITIYDAENRRQTFGMVNNSYVRLLDVEHGNKELCIYPLKEQYSTETAVVVAELVRDGSEWTFHTIGEGKHADINGIAALYM